MPWITDDDLTDRLLDALQKAELETSGAWSTTITDANRKAHRTVLTALQKRGYTLSQINRWDQRSEFNIDLGIFWALTLAGTTKNYSDTFIKPFDRREELKTIEVLIDDELVEPLSESDAITRKIKIGRMEADDDVFTMDMQL